MQSWPSSCMRSPMCWRAVWASRALGLTAATAIIIAVLLASSCSSGRNARATRECAPGNCPFALNNLTKELGMAEITSAQLLQMLGMGREAASSRGLPE